jgi:hypothetical protein
VRSDHPGTDPKLPSFRHPILQEHSQDLERAFDAWYCLKDEETKRKYLPKEPAEPATAYEGRLGRAVFSDFFKAGIEAFAGVLSRSDLIEPPASFERAQDNVDLEGNSLHAFWLTVDALCLRDGGVPILVEMPDGQPTDGANEAALKRRPYLVNRTRATCLNWRTTIVDSVEVVSRCTFLEWAEVDDPDGDFGVQYEERYRVIEPGKWTLYKLTKKADSSLTLEVVDEGQYLDAKQQPLAVCPVVWYPAEKAGFGRGGPPLRQVVMHCIEHFQMRSDLKEKTHKCAMPVPVRKGAPPPMPGQAATPLVIGPNTAIDVDKDGDFHFAEPSATSLAEQRSQIEAVEALINQQLLGFLSGDSKMTKTATQAQLEGGRTQVSIKAMGERKRSVMQSILAIWCLYTGEELAVGAGLTMDENAYDQPLDAQSAAQLQALAGGVELISQESAVEELQRGGFNRATSSVEDEMARIRAERPMLGAPTPGRNDTTNPVDVSTPPDQAQPTTQES